MISVVVFVCIFAVEQFFGHRENAETIATSPAEPKPGEPALNKRDIDLIASYGRRIDAQVAAIRTTKDRVAPSMPIDSQLAIIHDSLGDIRSLLSIPADDAQVTQSANP
jgi:hypothetical protein